jgi:hypothetical protein
MILVSSQHLRRRPIETFAKLFERFLVFVYHCFDRIVIQGYLPLLTRPEHIVHFFRDVHGQYPITPQVLAKRTLEYRGWVEGYARNHKIPVLKAEKGMKKEDCVRPHLRQMERRNQHGVYCIFTGMEMGSTFRSQMPKYPTDDPDCRIIRCVPSRFLHYYFHIRDPVIGPLAMCIATCIPFQTTYYLNGHNFMEIELRRQGVAFRKDDNALLSTSDPQALQAAADKLSAAIVEKRLNYWSWLLGPKFSEKAAKRSTCAVTTPSTRSDTAATSSSSGTSRSTRSLSTPAKWDCSAWPPTKLPASSGCASPDGSAASSTACSKNSTMAITCYGSTARTSWAACTRSSAPSCGWRSASTG